MKRRINPRGVRKIDVQAIRRQRRKEHLTRAQGNVRLWFPTEGKYLLREDVERMVKYALDDGWEEGVKDAHKAGLARIDEALEKGTLILPSKCDHELYRLHGKRNEDTTLVFRGSIAAPGYGNSYGCSECPKTFTVVGDTVYDNEELDAPLEMSIEDIR